jgi:hypothetical protein
MRDLLVKLFKILEWGESFLVCPDIVRRYPWESLEEAELRKQWSRWRQGTTSMPPRNHPLMIRWKAELNAMRDRVTAEFSKPPGGEKRWPEDRT